MFCSCILKYMSFSTIHFILWCHGIVTIRQNKLIFAWHCMVTSTENSKCLTSMESIMGLLGAHACATMAPLFHRSFKLRVGSLSYSKAGEKNILLACKAGAKFFLLVQAVVQSARRFASFQDASSREHESMSISPS